MEKSGRGRPEPAVRKVRMKAQYPVLQPPVSLIKKMAHVLNLEAEDVLNRQVILHWEITEVNFLAREFTVKILSEEEFKESQGSSES
jgi:hypothetical protein